MDETIALPLMSLPKVKGTFESRESKASLSMISLRLTLSFTLLGTSMPMALLPGIGASMRIPGLARERLRLS